MSGRTPGHGKRVLWRYFLPILAATLFGVLVSCRFQGIGPAAHPTALYSATALPSSTPASLDGMVSTPTPTSRRELLTRTVPEEALGDWTASPTVQPTAEDHSKIVAAECCGVFAWAGVDWLLVYDVEPRPGGWLVNVVSGERRWIAPRFGVPGADVIAVPDPISGRTTLFRWDGSSGGTIENGGAIVYPDATGRWIAWSVAEEYAVPSSAVSRISRVMVLDRASGEMHFVGRLRVSALAWSGVGSELLVVGETPEDSQAGLWVATPPSSGLHLVKEGRFFVNLRPVPGTRSVLVTQVLSGEPKDDGVWLIDLDRGALQHLPIETNYRVAQKSVWVLQWGEEHDRLIGYSLPDLEVCASAELGDQVLSDVWEIAPDGRWVAYWRTSDQRVVVEPLPGCHAGSQG